MSFHTIGNLGRLAKQEEVVNVIDNSMFRLHYRYTVLLLLLFSGLLISIQFFGRLMTCHMRAENFAPVTNCCWTQGSYILKYINKPVVKNYDDLNEAERQHVRRYGWSRQLLAAAYPLGSTQDMERSIHVYIKRPTNSTSSGPSSSFASR